MKMLRLMLSILAAWPVVGRAEENLILSSVGQGESRLPHPVVTAVVQTRGGDLWCGTYYGLARFDGVKFTVCDGREAPALPGKGVTVLFEDEEADLWVGMQTGAVVRIRDRNPEVVLNAGDGGTGEVQDIASDAAGDIWVVWADRTIVRVRDRHKLICDADITATAIGLKLVKDHEKRLWLIHRKGFHEVLPDGLVRADTGPEDSGTFIQCATASRLGGMWVVRDGHLNRWHGGRWEDVPDEAGWKAVVRRKPGIFVMAITELRDGRLLLGMFEGGAAVGKPGGTFQVYDVASGLPNPWVRCVLEDQEGNLWLGTGGSGLAALRPRRVTMVDVEQGPERHNIQCLLTTRNGALWVGTEGGGAWFAGDVSAEGLKNGFQPAPKGSPRFVWSIAEDKAGGILLGPWDQSVSCRPPGEPGFKPVPGWPAGIYQIKQILPGRDGSLWIGGSDELANLKDGVVTWRDGAGRPWAPRGQQSITEDEDGTIWVGTDDGRLVKRKGDSLEIFGKEQGLPGDSVIAILPRPNGSVWLGTMGGGLVRFRDGHGVALTSRDGLPSMMVSQLLADRSGYLWAGTFGGICRMDLMNLEACADGKVDGVSALVLSTSDGLATIGCSSGGHPGCTSTADGRLCFATQKGIAVVQPDSIKMNLRPPPVMINSLTRDGTSVNIRSDSIELPPGTVSCSVTYTGLSFTAPERVRFKTRLVGLEDAWQDAGFDRTAVYRYLRPGSYVFQVIAANNDGVWNEKGASIAFTIRGHIWQMLWFQLLMVAAVVVLVGLAVSELGRRKNEVRLAAAERRYALEKERTRIARDIHDDLGSGLTRIMLLSQTARDGLAPDSATGRELDAVTNAAEKLTRTMDEIVWAVDPKRDSLDSLVAYVGSAAQELLSAAGIRFRLEAPNHPPDWLLSAECRHGLFLAFKEALHNIVRHSGAKTVRVVFAIEPRAFTLCVEDDGRGFDPAEQVVRVHGGRGLEHLVKRLAEIGGTCDVDSRSGEGTTVRFRVPVDGVGLMEKSRT